MREHADAAACMRGGSQARTLAHLVLSASSVLKMTVDVGLVVGTMPAMTPIGSATLRMPSCGLSSITSHVLKSLYLL